MLPNEAVDADPRAIVRLAQEAEALGYSALWLPDHLLPPGPFGSVYGGVFEALTLLAHISGVTERIALGTSVLVTPLREPVLLAKQVATLERLAPGRVILGLGVGWERDEFAALRVPFNMRGRQTDETIALIEELHGSGGARGGVFAPRPTGRIPLLIGGRSDAALRRAARVGDYWQAYNVTVDEYAVLQDRLRVLAGDRVVAPGSVVRSADEDRDAWRDAGAEHLALHPGSLDTAAERLAAFAR